MPTPKKITDLTEITTIPAGSFIEVVDSSDGINKKVKSENSTAPVYAANEIPFGDGTTAGGVTNALLIFTPAVTGGSFNVSGDDGATISASLATDAISGIVSISAQNQPPSLNITLDASLDTINIVSVFDTAGIYVAGSNSAGLGAVTGLGIDILNDVYTLGNPNTNQLAINATVANLKTCPAYDDDAAAGGGGLVVGDIYQTTGGGAITTAGVLMIKQ